MWIIGRYWHGNCSLWMLCFFQSIFVQLFLLLHKVKEYWIYGWNLLLSVLVVFCLIHPLPSWIYPTAAVLLWLVQGRVDKDRVPLYFSSAEVVQVLAEWLSVHPGLFMDIGCGNGRLLALLAKRFPDRTFVGIERAIGPWLLARFYYAHALSNCRIVRGDFWEHSLANVSIVYAFLSPQPMLRLWDKYNDESSEGTWLISNSFAVPEIGCAHTFPLHGSLQHALYCYQKR